MGRFAMDESPSMEVGCEFEVCYRKVPESKYRNRNILQDVWYKAIVVEEAPEKCVQLLKDDFSTPVSRFLTIPSVIYRPVPPRVEPDCYFRIGTIVEADFKDSWVTGFLVKNIDDANFLVCFVSPPGVIQFKVKHLRLHLDWRDQGWNIQPKLNEVFLRRLAEKPMFSPGTVVEVSSVVDDAEVVWVPAMVIQEFKDHADNDDDADKDDDDDDEYRYIVRVCDKSSSYNSNKAKLNKTVDFHSLRPTPPSISVDEYQPEEYVEVFLYGLGWRQGRVIETLRYKWYTVLLEATNKEFPFKHSDLRPLKFWEDGLWKARESSSTQSQGSGDETEGSVTNANESDPPLTPPPGITTPQLIQVEAETQRKVLPEKTLPRNQNGSGDESSQENLIQVEAKTQRKELPKKTLPRNQNGSGDDSTQENGNSEDISRKRKREDNLCFVASAEEDKAKDTTMVLPFEKKLPIWKTLESMEIFKTVPQNPHFIPLVETREDSREMSAVGMMLTFSGLLEEVKALQHDDPMCSLLSLSDSFSKLEKHGFNVKAPQLRISRLLSLRDRQSENTDELKNAEKVAAEKECLKAENERKILELQRLNEETEKVIAQSKSLAAKLVQELDDGKLEFQTTASAPW